MLFDTSNLIYVSHFLSSWGDRMWSFAVALFLMDLASSTLLLPAAYGLTLSTTVLIFGPVVGDWIDRSPRLRAARLSLLIQNSSVAICAVILLVHKELGDEDANYVVFIKISAIMLGAVAQLASTASTIVVEKDWIVVIAEGKPGLLANLNAVLRRIDLSTSILAPLVCGQVMTLASLTVGCAFVAGWNVVSMCIEYFLLHVVYKRYPALAVKSKARSRVGNGDEDTVRLIDNQEEDDVQLLGRESQNPLSNKDDVVETEDGLGSSVHMIEADTSDNIIPGVIVQDATLDPYIPDNDDERLLDITESSPQHDSNNDNNCNNNSLTTVEPQQPRTSIWAKLFSFIFVIKRGWKLYMSQPLAKPGIGLSFLYMTVLGFDAITTAYAYNQCFSELLVGIMMGAGAITGISATFLFPILQRKIGLVRTGLFSSGTQILTLIPCIISVFAPGSPFYLLPENAPPNATGVIATTGATSTNMTVVMTYNTTADSNPNGVLLKCIDGITPPSSYLSLSLLMTGIILARIGLWGFDLTVTQLFQEQIEEQERGIVNGVQSSLNKSMDMIHFVLVIALPAPNMFGILVLLSAFFVCMGHLLYAVYARKVRGHILPCKKRCK